MSEFFRIVCLCVAILSFSMVMTKIAGREFNEVGNTFMIITMIYYFANGVESSIKENISALKDILSKEQ
ncbi:MAG: hypothetical protein H6937_07070 [Burkholderiales bacterium]|nr:hypothetical protein [Burkholderiales bacterium]